MKYKSTSLAVVKKQCNQLLIILNRCKSIISQEELKEFDPWMQRSAVSDHERILTLKASEAMLYFLTYTKYEDHCQQ